MSDRDTYLDDLARNGLRISTPEGGKPTARPPVVIVVDHAHTNKADLIARMGRLGLRRAD